MSTLDSVRLEDCVYGELLWGILVLQIPIELGEWSDIAAYFDIKDSIMHIWGRFNLVKCLGTSVSQ